MDDCARYGRLQVDGTRLTGFADKGSAGPGVAKVERFELKDVIGVAG